jgi:hypothetical protein
MAIVGIATNNGGGTMKKLVKFVSVKVEYDTEETWNVTLAEVQEILHMMNNLKRNAKIVEITQGVNKNDDGQDE